MPPQTRAYLRHNTALQPRFLGVTKLDPEHCTSKGTQEMSKADGKCQAKQMHNGGVPCTCCTTGAVHWCSCLYYVEGKVSWYQAYNQGGLGICPAVEWGYSLRHEYA